jgi:AP-3 complex subunit delta-1
MLQAHNPNYLKSSPTSGRKSANGDNMKDYVDIDEIPIAELSLDIPLKVHCTNYYDMLFKTIE